MSNTFPNDILAQQFLPYMGADPTNTNYGGGSTYGWNNLGQPLNPQEISQFVNSFGNGQWAPSVLGVHWLCGETNSGYDNRCDHNSGIGDDSGWGGCIYRNGNEDMNHSISDKLMSVYQQWFPGAPGAILCTAKSNNNDGCDSAKSRCVLVAGQPYEGDVRIVGGKSSAPVIVNDPQVSSVAYVQSSATITPAKLVILSNLKVNIWSPSANPSTDAPGKIIAISDLSRCDTSTPAITIVAPIDSSYNAIGYSFQLTFDYCSTTNRTVIEHGESLVSTIADSGSWIRVIEIMALTMTIIVGLLFFIKWYRS